jgi:hypothetical protein
MDAIDRRSMLRGILCAAVATGCSATLLPASTKAMPIAPQKDVSTQTSDLTHKAQAVVVGPPRRPLPMRHRRPRRRRCFWRRGRRICVY